MVRILASGEDAPCLYRQHRSGTEKSKASKVSRRPRFGVKSDTLRRLESIHI